MWLDAGCRTEAPEALCMRTLGGAAQLRRVSRPPEARAPTVSLRLTRLVSHRDVGIALSQRLAGRAEPLEALCDIRRGRLGRHLRDACALEEELRHPPVEPAVEREVARDRDGARIRAGRLDDKPEDLGVPSHVLHLLVLRAVDRRDVRRDDRVADDGLRVLVCDDGRVARRSGGGGAEGGRRELNVQDAAGWRVLVDDVVRPDQTLPDLADGRSAPVPEEVHRRLFRAGNLDLGEEEEVAVRRDVVLRLDPAHSVGALLVHQQRPREGLEVVRKVNEGRLGVRERLNVRHRLVEGRLRPHREPLRLLRRRALLLLAAGDGLGEVKHRVPLRLGRQRPVRLRLGLRSGVEARG
mmetsp:Transcript_22572/g.67329  ORF Transcript_22572/g.67329 Transcript_22572/m.67329 type:complete len:353 (-) Transcript_22572:100-1158(-)